MSGASELEFMASVVLGVRLFETAAATNLPLDQIDPKPLKSGVVQTTLSLTKGQIREPAQVRHLSQWIGDRIGNVKRPSDFWKALMTDPPDFIEVIPDEVAPQGALIRERLPSGIWSEPINYDAFAQRIRDIKKRGLP